MKKEQNPEQGQALCHFENKKEKLTVGDVFDMHCTWPLHLAVLSPPVRIEFPKPSLNDPQAKGATGPYSLVILKTKSMGPGEAQFEVTSYQPGHYNTSLKLISDNSTLLSHPLSWQVESVVPANQQEVKPYPPYGPWLEPLPPWYWGLGALTLISLLAIMALKIRSVIKRKQKIKEVRLRLKQKGQDLAYQQFIGQLNQLIWKISPHAQIDDKKTDPIVTEIEQSFRLFLENKFFIYALKETPKTILKQLKKYYPLIYQQEAKLIFNVFAELNRLSVGKHQPEELEQAIDMARQVAHKSQITV